MSQENDWFWCYSRHENGTYFGRFPCCEDALIEGKKAFGDAQGLWIAEAKNTPIQVSDWIDGADLLEIAEDAVFINLRANGEWDDGVFSVTSEQEADLTKRIKAVCNEWQKDHG